MAIKTIYSKDFRHIYAVGDIHGEITQFEEALRKVNFDKKQDLILSVGDLIDRGENSFACLRLMDEPWFECVMGNHEKMAFDAITKRTLGLVMYWKSNGGNWFYELKGNAEAKRLLIKAGSLPLIIELIEPNKKTVICHADYPLDHYSTDIGGLDMHLLWSRERIRRAKEGYTTEIKGADLFIFGHTPLKEPLKAANQVYIDTAACFGNKLTIMQLT